MKTVDEFRKERDEAIYQSYLEGLQYRIKAQAAKFNIPVNTYRNILAKQKKLNSETERALFGESKPTVKDGK